MIDWTKPIETVTGLPVRLECVSSDGLEYTVRYPADEAFGRNVDGPWIYPSNGHALNDFLLDLRNVSPLTRG